MSDANYSRIALHDMGNSTEPAQDMKHTPSPSSSWNNDDLDKPPNARKSRRWNVDYLSNESMVQSMKNMRRATIKAGSSLKSPTERRKSMRHVSAFLIFFIFGLLPLIVYFKILDAPFRAKPVTCGDAAQVQEEAPGIEGLFTVDRTAGRFPFWLAKLLDTIWDLVVARGMQLLAGWISYVVFCNAMLRALEESPIPYRTFTGLAMNGASLWTVGCIVRDLGRHSRKRTVLLFTYAAVALVYVLAMPTLFSTMTGYISVSSAFTKVPGTSQFVPTDEFVPGYTYSGLPDVPDGTCVSRDLVAPADYRFDSRNAICNSTCVTNFPNGTHKDLATGELLSSYDAGVSTLLAQPDCTYSPNETYTGLSAPMAPLYTDSSYLRGIHDLYNPDNIAYNCAAPITLTLPAATANTTTTLPYATLLAHLVPDSSYCYNGQGFDATTVRLAGRCLPDTGDGDASAAYQWGFSAMLTSVVLVVHGVWAASLYAVWVEAECGSVLWVAAGRRLTALGAAWFAVEAAGGREVGPEGVEGVGGGSGVVVRRGLGVEAWGDGGGGGGGGGTGGTAGRKEGEGVGV